MTRTPRSGFFHDVLRLLRSEAVGGQGQRRPPRPPSRKGRRGRARRIVLGELNVDVERQGTDQVHALLTGKSSSRDAGLALQLILGTLLSMAREERATLVLHFERLEYFNSSTIAALLQFIHAARQEAAPVVVRYDAALRWQAVSFDALQRALESLEPRGAPSVSFLGAAKSSEIVRGGPDAAR